MARYPGAIWEPLGPQTEPRMRSHDIACLHTMAGSLAGTDAYFRQQGYGGLESHFGLGRTGIMKQWQDISHEADANLDGNDRVISIETADRGEGFPIWSGSDVPAWTPQQVDKLVDCLLWVTSKEAHRDCPATWACHQHGIPRALIPDTQLNRRGIGYHRQGIDPWRHPNGERWSQATGKVCPGDRRIHQLTTVIIPRVQAATQEEDDMTPEECRTVVRKELDTYLAAALSWLTTGRGNGIVAPTLPKSAWAWADDPGTVTLNEVLAAVKTPQQVYVDEAEIASVVAAAVIEALPDEVTDQVTAEEVEAAVVAGLGSVRFVPDTD